MKYLRKLYCYLFGHTKELQPMMFFRNWNGIREIGSLHCKRCGAMLGEYNREMTESL